MLGCTNANCGLPPCTAHVIRKGKVVENADSTLEIKTFGPEDVFIKGANAVDRDGNAGIFVSSDTRLAHLLPAALWLYSTLANRRRFSTPCGSTDCR